MSAVRYEELACTCGALYNAIPKDEIYAAYDAVDAMDCPAAEKLVRRLALIGEWSKRETAAVRDSCICHPELASGSVEHGNPLAFDSGSERSGHALAGAIGPLPPG